MHLKTPVRNGRKNDERNSLVMSWRPLVQAIAAGLDVARESLQALPLRRPDTTMSQPPRSVDFPRTTRKFAAAAIILCCQAI
jgi:hypothetical protein